MSEPINYAYEQIVGRALIDPEYRTRLTTRDDAGQIAALQEAGLSATEAQAVLPRLIAATDAVNDLAAHEIFGAGQYAA